MFIFKRLSVSIISNILVLSVFVGNVFAQNTLIKTVQEQPIIPVMINRTDVPVLWLELQGAGELQQVTLDLSGTTVLSNLQTIKIFSIGGERLLTVPAEATLFGQVIEPTDKKIIRIKGLAEIKPENGNWFIITATLKPETDLLHHLGLSCTELTVSDHTIKPEGKVQPFLQLGYRVRHKGDDGSNGYRIPGVITSNAGTLLATYDIRCDSQRDLQGDIDIGLSRSADGGQTWLPMQVALDMGTFGGLPQKYNGVSDAGILVDRQTGRIFVFGCWMHGLRNEDGSFRNDLTETSKAWAHQWHGGKVGSGPGMSPQETAQFLMAYSDDDGQTWSKPVNITKQVKKPQWYLFCTAPGNGFTAEDGTLVMPVQGRDENQTTFSTIMTSQDHGKTWQVGSPARFNTTESAAIQPPDGSIMLNMRDNRNRHDKSNTNGRAVAVTDDYGKIWTKHISDHRADLLPEPVCMASLIRTTVDDQSILFFSNPNNKYSRKNLTVKASLDDGKTWPAEFQAELDSAGGAYSCLTRVDGKSIGILYESSQGYLVFQKIPIDQIIRSNPGIGKESNEKASATGEVEESCTVVSQSLHEKRMKPWRDAKFGLFLTWGPYSLYGGTYKGEKLWSAEWIQENARIPWEEYWRHPGILLNLIQKNGSAMPRPQE